MNNTLQEEFSRILTDLSKGNEDALIRLWIFFSKYSDGDEGEYYKRQCISWTGFALEAKGNFNTALMVYENLLRETDKGDPSFVHVLHSNAKLLWKLKKGEEALAMLDKILSIEDDNSIFYHLDALLLYTDIVGSSNQRFSEKYQQATNEIADTLGISTENIEGYAEKVRHLYQENQASNVSFSKILASGAGRAEMIDALKQFEKNTQADYYRKMADAHLSSLVE